MLELLQATPHQFRQFQAIIVQAFFESFENLSWSYAVNVIEQLVESRSAFPPVMPGAAVQTCEKIVDVLELLLRSAAGMGTVEPLLPLLEHTLLPFET